MKAHYPYSHRVHETNEADKVFEAINDNFTDSGKDKVQQLEESKDEKISDIVVNVDLFQKDKNSINLTSGGNNSTFFKGERLRIINNGIKLYKKFYNNLSKTSKDFDPRKADKIKPEDCGYALRVFKLNVDDNCIEIIDTRSKVETKIGIKDIKRIIMPNETKKFLKERKIEAKTETDIRTMLKPDFIQFSLVIEGKGVDLIAESYQEYLSFNGAIEELIRKR